MSPQGPQGRINAPAVVTQGGSIDITLGSNESTIDIKDSHTGEVTTMKVPPGKDITLPVPNLPGGTIIAIRIGNGARSRTIFVEIIAPGP